MDDATTKGGLLAAIERERAGWDALVAEVGEGRFHEPGAMGEWTFKDVVGHLNGWRERTVRRLEAAARGEDPGAPPWPAQHDEDDEAGVDAINAWFYAKSQARPAAELLAETRGQFDRIAAAVGELAEDALFDPHRYPWLDGHSLGPGVVGGSFGHLHEEHEPGLRAWLAGGDPAAGP